MRRRQQCILVQSWLPRLGAIAFNDGYTTLKTLGYHDIVIAAPWSRLEPSQGAFSVIETANIQTQIDTARAAGLNVHLDVGLQFTPAWVFALFGGTRFKNQFGDEYGGVIDSGHEIANGITNFAVRDRIQTYIKYLGRALRDISLVRIGGGAFNELRYPTSYAGSQPGSVWFYDASSQSLLPSNI